MSYIKSIQNLIIGKMIDLQEKKAYVLNKPESSKTYIMVINSDNPWSARLVQTNLENAHYLYDGTFSTSQDENNYLVVADKIDCVNQVPFMVALKSGKEILPVYVTEDLSSIAYGYPFKISDCYKENGQFDYTKINGYIDQWKSSIESVKRKIKR